MARGTMPSVAQETSPTQQSSCKKRRRDDIDNHLQQLPLYASFVTNFTSPTTNKVIYSSHSTSNTPRNISPDDTLDGNLDSLLHHHRHHHHHHHQHQHVLPLAARKVIPLPYSKRQRTSVETEVEPYSEADAMRRSLFSSPSRRQHQLNKTSARGEESQTTKLRPIHPAHTTSAAASSTPASALAAPVMSRCYICSRKPTKKADLDSFADCQGCGQRTCFVCMRQCLGWGPTLQPMEVISQFPSMQTETSFTMLDAEDSAAGGVNFSFGKPHDGQREEGGWAGSGHRQMVCSRCCVEKGADGDVVCLGCLPFVEG